MDKSDCILYLEGYPIMGYEIVKTTAGYSENEKYRIRVWVELPNKHICGHTGWGKNLSSATEDVKQRINSVNGTD